MSYLKDSPAQRDIVGSEAVPSGRTRYTAEAIEVEDSGLRDHLHFSAAKQAKTRQARIEKCLPDMIAGLGFRD